MITFEGNLHKMRTTLASPVQYTLLLRDAPVDMNMLVGSPINITFRGQINCVNCGRLTKKSFGQGFCYPCFIKAPQNAECIIRPELCRAHMGEGRDVAWEKEHHMQPHIVYLAQTDTIKVGVTRNTQVPTRWIDQGAWKAIPIAEFPYRYLAGRAEVALKGHFTDKTNWRNMLTNKMHDLDLKAFSVQVVEQLPEDLQQYHLAEEKVLEIKYPVEQYPSKVKSLSLDKNPEISGVISGIRGQYLLFDDGRVINIRNHSGYYIVLSVD